jgi:hypothetical protein
LSTTDAPKIPRGNISSIAPVLFNGAAPAEDVTQSIKREGFLIVINMSLRRVWPWTAAAGILGSNHSWSTDACQGDAYDGPIPRSSNHINCARGLIVSELFLNRDESS